MVVENFLLIILAKDLAVNYFLIIHSFPAGSSTTHVLISPYIFKSVLEHYAPTHELTNKHNPCVTA